MLNKLINILKKNQVEDIYVTGCFDSEDNEFIVNSNYLYFEIDSKFICFEAVESEFKIKIYITPSILYHNEVENWIDGKARVSKFAFINPLLENRKTITLSLIDLEKEEDYLICSDLHFKFDSGDFVFLNPGFLGIEIGGYQQKEFWEYNRDTEEKYIEKKIDF